MQHHLRQPRTATNTAKQRRYRARRELGIKILSVPADWRLMQLFVEKRIVPEAIVDSGDVRLIGQAIYEWFARSANV
jgi:hypothetical protein